MKLVKKEFVASLILAATMFGALSFTTTPVAAQNTSSNSAAAEIDDKSGLFLAFMRGFTQSFIVGLALNQSRQAAYAITATSDYPADALD